MIRVVGVGHHFDGVEVLRDVGFELPTGQTLGLIGPGGAGKSLVLKMICGLVRPTIGRIEVEGEEVTALDEEALFHVRRRIGMVFQNYALFDSMDVGGNVAFPLERRGGLSREDIAARVAARLRTVHLPDVERLWPQALSGGMRKRVCLARATIDDPPILLCDDPTAGLDPVTTSRIFRMIREQQRRTRATAIIVSHEIAGLLPLCDRVVMLDLGRVVWSGEAEVARRVPLSMPEAVRELLAAGGAGD